ncbi:LysE family translocator [Plantibacter sp. YIM 135347]|uniref:LysE family translocator n=1 Tax=Plantibacter sp. YIM 135347 TaxID=3423919 RepID=UPI003D341329
MDASLIGQFWVVAVLLALTPGADWAYAIAAGLRARTILPSILGMLTGYAVVITIVAVGVGALVTTYPMLLTVLTLAGGAYLIWLGLSTLFRPVPPIQASDEPIRGGAVGQFFRGAGVSAINPKGLLLLLALLPQFTSATGWPSTTQMLVLGALHLLNCAVIYSSVAHLARRLLRSRPKAAVVVTKASGIVMTLIGAGILVERIIELL